MHSELTSLPTQTVTILVQAAPLLLSWIVVTTPSPPPHALATAARGTLSRQKPDPIPPCPHLLQRTRKSPHTLFPVPLRSLGLPLSSTLTLLQSLSSPYQSQNMPSTALPQGLCKCCSQGSSESLLRSFTSCPKVSKTPSLTFLSCAIPFTLCFFLLALYCSETLYFCVLSASPVRM